MWSMADHDALVRIADALEAMAAVQVHPVHVVAPYERLPATYVTPTGASNV